MNEKIGELILEYVERTHIIENADMRKYTSFKAGGNAKFLVDPQSIDELSTLIGALKKEAVRFFIMGNGTNFVVADEGFDGVIIRLGNGFDKIEQVADNILRAGAGAKLSSVARAALQYGLSGLEFAAGIPGSMGGAVYMNAGAYGGEMRDILISAQVLDIETLEISEMGAVELDFGYRSSALQSNNNIVLSVMLELNKEEPSAISMRMSEFMHKRNEKQPLTLPSAGSFFKRPLNNYAGALIQDAGLKGMSIGGAQISPLHAGFMVNRDGATATDIENLCALVQNVVYDKFEILLEPEVEILR